MTDTKDLFAARESAASCAELHAQLVAAYDKAHAEYLAVDQADKPLKARLWRARKDACDRVEQSEVDAEAAKQRVAALEHQIEQERRQGCRDSLSSLDQRTSRAAIAERLTPLACEIAGIYERLGELRDQMQAEWDSMFADHCEANRIRAELHRLEMSELTEEERAEINASAFVPILPAFEGGHSALDRFVQACRAAIADRGINPDNRARLIPGA